MQEMGWMEEIKLTRVCECTPFVICLHQQSSVCWVHASAQTGIVGEARVLRGAAG